MIRLRVKEFVCLLVLMAGAVYLFSIKEKDGYVEISKGAVSFMDILFNPFRSRDGGLNELCTVLLGTFLSYFISTAVQYHYRVQWMMRLSTRRNVFLCLLETVGLIVLSVLVFVGAVSLLFSFSMSGGEAWARDHSVMRNALNAAGVSGISHFSEWPAFWEAFFLKGLYFILTAAISMILSLRFRHNILVSVVILCLGFLDIFIPGKAPLFVSAASISGMELLVSGFLWKRFVYFVCAGGLFLYLAYRLSLTIDILGGD